MKVYRGLQGWDCIYRGTSERNARRAAALALGVKTLRGLKQERTSDGVYIYAKGTEKGCADNFVSTEHAVEIDWQTTKPGKKGSGAPSGKRKTTSREPGHSESG